MLMVRTMILKTATNKKGSYIVESTISLPIFMIAVIVMSSILLMYSCIEDANFIAATEMRRAAAESIYVNTTPLLPIRISNRIYEHDQVKDIDTKDFRFKQAFLGNDEMIAIKLKMEMKTNNPLDLASKADYDVALVSRAYVGKTRNERNMSAAELMNKNAEAVFIFPQSGEKYHNKGCGVLHAAYQATVLNSSLRSKYSSCPLCHSKTAKIGDRVYYFPNDGEDYHLAGCPSLERNYIEIEKQVAIERGYTPCKKCGG